jgi:murein DD-endopeptidase MepM/ murein hydrolase activator NlpD
MVNLSIDPPPSPFSPRGGGVLRWLVYPILLLIGLAGGFVLGRKTAQSDLRLPAATAKRAPAQGPAGPAPAGGAVAAAPAAEAPGAQPGANGPAAAPTGATSGRECARPAAPGAPANPAAAAPGAPQGPLVRTLSATLRGPLEESIAAALAPPDRAWASQLTQVVNRILVWSLQIAREGRKGDKLEVVFELPGAQPTGIVSFGDGGPASKEPIVLALRYGSQKLGRVLTAYRFKPDGSAFAHYYDAAGADVEQHLVDSPVEDYEQITSLLRDGRRHKGVDYKTPVGTPVKAPFDGEVTRRNWHFSANGNCLELRDPRTGRKAIFLHLEAAPREMQPGRKVAKGEVIARSGNSGHSTAPHLHYQLEASDGKVLDPFAVLPTRKVTLDGATRAAFDKERQRLEPMLVAGR